METDDQDGENQTGILLEAEVIKSEGPPMMAADCVVLMSGSVQSYASLGT